MCIRLTCRAKTYQALTEVTVLASRRHGVFVVFFKTFFYVAVHRPPSNCRHSTVFLSSLAAKAQIFQHCSDEPENCWYQVLYTYYNTRYLTLCPEMSGQFGDSLGYPNKPSSHLRTERYYSNIVMGHADGYCEP